LGGPPKKENEKTNSLDATFRGGNLKKGDPISSLVRRTKAKPYIEEKTSKGGLESQQTPGVTPRVKKARIARQVSSKNQIKKRKCLPGKSALKKRDRKIMGIEIRTREEKAQTPVASCGGWPRRAQKGGRKASNGGLHLGSKICTRVRGGETGKPGTAGLKKKATHRKIPWSYEEKQVNGIVVGKQKPHGGWLDRIPKHREQSKGDGETFQSGGKNIFKKNLGGSEPKQKNERLKKGNRPTPEDPTLQTSWKMASVTNNRYGLAHSSGKTKRGQRKNSQ